uniref:calpastatin isoform X4 n=1 Tax=Pristiophorus japonicus TaxID=55135 RepID=UPI00398F3DE7
MWQRNKRKGGGSRKGEKKTDLGTSSKQGVSMSAQASEEKTKIGQLAKAEGSKPISSTSKSSEKPGLATSHKSADSSKAKTTSAKPSGATGGKDQQPQSVATQQSKMGLGLFRLAQQEPLVETFPSNIPDTSVHQNTDRKIQNTKQSRNTDTENANSVPFKEDLLQKHLEDVMKLVTDMKSQIMSEITHMIEEQISILKATIVKSLESASVDQKKAIIAPLKKVSEIEGNLKTSAAKSVSASQSDGKAPLKASTAKSVSASQSSGKDLDALDLLAQTLPSEAPDNSAPKYTGPAVKESDATKKKAERVGETEGSIPPDYRFNEKADPKDKGKLASPSTHQGAKPKVTEKNMTEDDILESLSTDFVHSSPVKLSQCSVAPSHSAPPLSMQQQAPLKASTAKSVSASQSSGKDLDALDLLAQTLPSEAPDNSAPKYTGPAVKESDATKKKAERVGETEGSIPPDYRFNEKADPKDKGKLASPSTHQGAKPKVTEKNMTEDDILESLSTDFVHSSPVKLSQCSVAPSHSAPPLSMQQQAPLKPSTAKSVSASQSSGKDLDALDLLAQTLPSEAPDNSAPKYTGPAVKESDATKKKAERVGETEGSIPPDYRFNEKADPKDKGKLASPSTHQGTKPKVTEKNMTEDDILESLSTDFVHSSPVKLSQCSVAPSHSAPPLSMQQQAPLKASTAKSVSASQSSGKDLDALDLLAQTLPSEAPDNSAPKYTGPAVKESDATKKKAERVGETEGSIPPDYRFNEKADPQDKGKLASPSTHQGAKPKVTEKNMTEDDILESLSTDFVHSSPVKLSQCSVAPSHSAPPLSMQQQAPLKASTAKSVSASQSSGKDLDALDLLAQTLPSEAPDNSAPKYTGPAVKESDATKKKAERVGETEGSIPPDYRFNEKADPKDKGKLASPSTHQGAKPKVTEKNMTEDDILESLSTDFVHSSPVKLSQCSVAPSHSAPPLSMQQQAPLKTSTAKSVSASQSSGKDLDALDLLAQTLPSEAPDNSAPKYTGPAVKESDATKKKAERVGETEGSIPPDYRFNEKADPKGKGKLASPSTHQGAKPKNMTEDDILESLSTDFVHSSPVKLSQCSVAPSHSAPPLSMQQQAPLKASTAKSVSASQSSGKDLDALDLLAQTLPSEAPDNSAPKYTGPAVKESDATKKKAERVGETEGSIPPDYRFNEKADPKDKGKLASPSTHQGAKPKVSEKNMTEDDILESLSTDFVHSSPVKLSQCSVAPSHSAPPLSMQQQDLDALDLLAQTLPSEAPDNSAPKYTGPAVKESDATKKKAERVGETEESIPPAYRFTEQIDPKDKGKLAFPSTGPVEKPKATEKLLTKSDLVEALSSDFDTCSSASHSVTQVSKEKEDKGKQAFPSTGPGAKPKATEKLQTKSDLVEALSSDFDTCSSASHSVTQVSKEKEDKGKQAFPSTGPGAKPKATEKLLTKSDLVEGLSPDFDTCSSASHSVAHVSEVKEKKDPSATKKSRKY